jgi:hypothetical protein
VANRVFGPGAYRRHYYPLLSYFPPYTHPTYSITVKGFPLTLLRKIKEKENNIRDTLYGSLQHSLSSISIITEPRFLAEHMAVWHRLYVLASIMVRDDMRLVQAMEYTQKFL